MKQGKTITTYLIEGAPSGLMSIPNFKVNLKQ